MLKEWIVDGAEIIAANYRLNAATEFGKQVLEECGRVSGVKPTYHFYGDVERDDEQVKTGIGTDGVPHETRKHLKVNTVKELIKGIKKSLLIMKLAAMDSDIREY